MRHLLLLSVLAFFMPACRTLTSVTTIPPNERFVLGNNEHGSYRVHLQNTSPEVITVYRAPVGGGKHSSVEVQPREKVSVQVESNTALVLVNPSGRKVDVKLKVIGDTNLSMGYQR